MQLKAKMRMSISLNKLMDAIDRKRSKVLQRTGAYGRVVMRRSIRPPKSGKKNRTIVVDGRQLLVPVKGMVVDRRTNRPVTAEQARKARELFARQMRGQGEGQPPRRGPKDLLRKGILWVVSHKSQSVIIGVEPFAKQPSLLGATTVPQLLNYGGGQNINGVLAKYRPRPFVEPAMEITLHKMKEEIERTAL